MMKCLACDARSNLIHTKAMNHNQEVLAAWEKSQDELEWDSLG